MPNKSNDRRALTIENTKLGVLLYEEVIPVGFLAEAITDGLQGSLRNAISILNEIVPESMKDADGFKLIRDLNLFSITEVFHALAQNQDLSEHELTKEKFANFKTLTEELAEKGFSAPVVSDLWKVQMNRLFDENPDFLGAPILAGSSKPTADSQEASPLLTLANLPIIDTSNISWDKILEFKKDKDSASQLRRFRLFTADNYEGKSKSFVEDDLNERLEAYEETIRRWQFDTYHGAAHSLLTSKTLAGSGTASLVSTLMGAPVPAILAAIGGVTVEIGKFTLSLAKSRHDLRNDLKQNPIAYLARAKSDLEEN